MPDPTPADVLGAYYGSEGFPLPDADPRADALSAADVLRAFGHVLAPGLVAPPAGLPTAPRTVEQAFGEPRPKTSRDYATELSAGKTNIDPLETALGVAGGSPATFIGPAARTFPKQALAEANRLFAAGKTAEEVRQATGINLNAAGQPQFEISDAGDWRMSMPPKGAQGVKLGQVYEQPNLYAAYPELRDYPVSFDDPIFHIPNMEVAGGLNLGTTPPSLLLNPKSIKSLDEMRSTILHEVGGHGVSKIEGWPSGGGMESPEVVKLAQQTFEKRRTDYKRAIDTVMERRDNYVDQRIEAGDKRPTQVIQEEYFDKANPADAAIARDALIEQGKHNRGRMLLEEKFKAYQGLAGEEQARNIQARRDLTAEQLRAMPPETTQNTPYSEQTIRYGPQTPTPAPALEPRGPGPVQSAFEFSTEPKSFTERMAQAQDIAFRRAQRGQPTGDYGLGTTRRTAPDAPKGSFEDLAARQQAGMKADQERIINEYRAATGQPPKGVSEPLLAPGERPEDIAFDIERLGPSGAVTRGVESVRDAPYALPAANANIPGMGRRDVQPRPAIDELLDWVARRSAEPPVNPLADLPRRGNVTGIRPDVEFQLEQLPPEPYDFLTGRRPDAPFPQYADVYPPVGPPTMKPKTKGEGTYPAKTLTPEGEAVAKARTKIMEEMSREGYQPFFDPSQRFPAEFSKQPGPHVDTAQAVAKRQATIDEHLKTIGAPETRARLREGYSRGLDLADTQAWYLLGQVERKMIEDMGEAAGRKHFRDTFATAMSATTSGMQPQENLIMAQYLNYLRKTGQPFPTESFQTPVAVGGQRTMPNIESYEKVFSDPRGPYEALGLENPKRTDFAQAQMGNPNAFTIDEQMAHGMIGKDVPQKGTYGLMTQVGREEAARAGVEPQRYQDVGWGGFKKMIEEEARARKGFRPYGEGEGYQGKPMISEVNDMIERIHRLTGRPRAEVWRKVFIENSIPVYGVGGLTLGSVLMGQQMREPAAQ